MHTSGNASYKDDFFLSVLELAKQEGGRFTEEHNTKYAQDVIVSVKEQILQGAKSGDVQVTVHLQGGALGIAMKFLQDNGIGFDVYVHDHEQDRRDRRQGIVLPDTRELLVYLYDREHPEHYMLLIDKWKIPERQLGALL